MLNIEFLDVLYTWKVEAEQHLDKLIENNKNPVDSNETLRAREKEIQHAQEIVRRHANVIRSYILHHKT